MANSFCDFAQRVGAVDNGNHGSSLDEIGENCQILAIDFGEQSGHFLTGKGRPNCVLKHSREQIPGAPVWVPAAA